MAAYQTLYQSSVEFGMKKQLESEEGMDELEQIHQEYILKEKDLQRRKV